MLFICFFIGTAHPFAQESVFFAHLFQYCFTCPPLITVVHLLVHRSSADAKLLRLLPALLPQSCQHFHRPLLTLIPSRMGETSGNFTGIKIRI
jgi:hypothetical protein